MAEDNPGREAGASRASATSQRAKKRRREPSPQEEIFSESSRLKRRPTPSSQPAPPPPLHLSPHWPPGEGTVPPSFGPTVPNTYPPTTHHQPLFPTPSVVWPPLPATPAAVTAQRGTPTYAELITRPTKDSAASPSVNHDLASINIEELPRGASLPALPENSPSVPRQHPNPGGSSSNPRLEDLPDPPADQRPLQTIRVLASAALRSEPKGKLTLEEMVDRICTRFEYFQSLQNRNKLKKSIRHALSLYSEFKCSEDSESHAAKKVWRLTDEVLPNKYVRERKRKSRRTTAPDGVNQEGQVRPEREANTRDVVEESTCISESEDIEFIGIVRAEEKEKGSASKRSHTMKGTQAREKVSLATPAHPATKPKLKRVLEGAAARSIINQILAEKGSNDRDPMRSHSTSPDEGPSSIRMQASRWGMSSSSQTVTPSALLQTPTAHSSLPFSAVGASSTSFPPPSGLKAFGPVVQPNSSNSVSTGFGSFAKFGTLGSGGFGFAAQAPNPAGAGTGTESGQPIADDGEGS